MRLVRVPETLNVSVTTGAFDIFAWVALPSPEQLHSFLLGTLGKIPGVKRSETFVHAVGQEALLGSPALSRFSERHIHWANVNVLYCCAPVFVGISLRLVCCYKTIIPDSEDLSQMGHSPSLGGFGLPGGYAIMQANSGS